MAKKFKFELGTYVRDILVPDFCGSIVGRTEYVTGCIQYGVLPAKLVDGKYPDYIWLDETRIEKVAKPRAKVEKAKGGPSPAAPTFN